MKLSAEELVRARLLLDRWQDDRPGPGGAPQQPVSLADLIARRRAATARPRG